MPAEHGGVACPKPERTPRKTIGEIRQYVFARERGTCRCCRNRPAMSMHELRPRSLGGKVSKRNSVAVCGDGVTGCHGMLQRHEILIELREQMAEDAIYFIPNERPAYEWMKLKHGERLESRPMREMEAE
jgi:hypothetical protein